MKLKNHCCEWGGRESGREKKKGSSKQQELEAAYTLAARVQRSKNCQRVRIENISLSPASCISFLMCQSLSGEFFLYRKARRSQGEAEHGPDADSSTECPLSVVSCEMLGTD